MEKGVERESGQKLGKLWLVVLGIAVKAWTGGLEHRKQIFKE